MSVSDVSFDEDSIPEEGKNETDTIEKKVSKAEEIVEIAESPYTAHSPERNGQPHEQLYQSPFAEFAQRSHEEHKSSSNSTDPKKSYHFLCGAMTIPRGGTAGEDAYLTHPRALGVADGVSGWYQYGIDSAAFAQQLMHFCLEKINEIAGSNTLNTAKPEIDPLPVLEKAYEQVVAVGSSTATLVVINGDSLHGRNLGDSGFVCFTNKNGEYVSGGVSKEQQHNFNTPFQLSKFPTEEDIEELKSHVEEKDISQLIHTMERNELCQDLPENSDKYLLQLHENDILILGTDGMIEKVCNGA